MLAGLFLAVGWIWCGVVDTHRVFVTVKILDT